MPSKNAPQIYLAVLLDLQEGLRARIKNALERSGWTWAAAEAGNLGAIAGADMLIANITGPTGEPSFHIDIDTIFVAVTEEKLPSASFGDATLCPTDSAEVFADAFRRWLPPETHALDRMESLFGREGLVPIVTGLRDALRSALPLLEQGGAPDAHKLSGLAGTLGFTEASNCWQAMDRGAGRVEDARRASKTAVIAIDRWLGVPGQAPLPS
ncbi:MAG: hypothetical protein ABW039_07970 [Sphingobium sp.]